MNDNDEKDLNAYVDGELLADEKAEILNVMAGNADIARKVCELNNLKSQLQLAYANPPGINRQRNSNTTGSRLGIAAAVSALAIGLSGGWLLHDQMPAAGIAGSERFVLLDPTGSGQAPATVRSEETRIVFHVTDADQTNTGELLDDIEQMLVAYQRESRLLRVEVVGHGEGMDMLRDGLSQHKTRIRGLAQRFDNLTFVACQNTIDRLKVAEGIEIKVLPEATVIESGVSHVVKRQKEGWSYIRV